ncbi:uncharacterized protein FOMMEDRAFT_134824 [Fomitiporia mediterranea MF3/22]|uniref:uncharacterized protein n=1 Tax=Fomitiporia mediterranea (strain MF3/22) TaxID=694068 RepID=UPI00044081CB|nr:uncharacterized protein FOMMEDRAFT_134824 [Fomitiporia mediterranea MF3/22]EJD02242.1 hypothetical protein FOMMEDRAFT_134824 [Fomitiporia mediterranea MF3/22]
MSSTQHKKPPSPPRPSASLIVVNAKNEILMVQRHTESRSFGGAHVFPGGNYDSAQDSSLEMTAIRETFEETGVLLASRVTGSEDSGIPESLCDEARKAIHAGKRLFTDFLSEHGLVADTSSLLPFSTWVTPSDSPVRFRAKFFVTFLPVASALSGPSSGTHTHRLPTPDSPNDGAGPNSTSQTTEVVSAEYIHPSVTLAAFARGEVGLMPPQLYILTTLNDIFKSGSSPGSAAERDSSENININTSAHREQVARLSRSMFGRMEFNPQHLVPHNSPDGSHILVLEGDEARGGRKGCLHRTIFVPQKGTLVPKKMNLLRNFDVFTDLEEVVSRQAKL